MLKGGLLVRVALRLRPEQVAAVTAPSSPAEDLARDQQDAAAIRAGDGHSLGHSKASSALRQGAPRHARGGPGLRGGFV